MFWENYDMFSIFMWNDIFNNIAIFNIGKIKDAVETVRIGEADL